MGAMNKRGISFVAKARAQVREKKGAVPRLGHVLRQKLNSGKRTSKSARQTVQRRRLRDQELAARGLLPADALAAEADAAAEEAPVPLPHQASAIAAAIAAAKGGRVKGRARKAVRAAGLDRPTGARKGRAAAAVAAALAARQAREAAAAPAGGDAGEEAMMEE
jgi:hypothetical protein